MQFRRQQWSKGRWGASADCYHRCKSRSTLYRSRAEKTSSDAAFVPSSGLALVSSTSESAGQLASPPTSRCSSLVRCSNLTATQQGCISHASQWWKSQYQLAAPQSVNWFFDCTPFRRLSHNLARRVHVRLAHSHSRRVDRCSCLSSHCHCPERLCATTILCCS